MTPTRIIRDFRGKHQFLSNFYVHELMLKAGTVLPNGDVLDRDEWYPHSEGAYQALKADNSEDRQQFFAARMFPSGNHRVYTPGQSKRAGRAIDMTPTWEVAKYGAMKMVLDAKFQPDSALSHNLLCTSGAYLVEGNSWHDQVWGDCSCPTHLPETGENWLGNMLMARRAVLGGFVSAAL